MKKLLTLILALSVLFMTSCGNAGVSETTENTTASTTESTTEITATTGITNNGSSTVQAQTTGPSVSGDMGNGICFNEDEYDEYLEFISTNEDIPENFVTYEEISEYGEFYFFLIFWDFDKNMISNSYFYTLKTETGKEIKVEISNENIWEKISSNSGRVPKEISLDGMTDMTFCGDVDVDKNTGMLYIDIGEMRYWYYNGSKELAGITWDYNDLCIEIPVDKRVRNLMQSTLSNDKGIAFIQRLFDPNKAEAAVAEFNAGISD